MDFINVKQYIKSEFDNIITEASENFFKNNRYDVWKRLSFKCHIDDLYCDETNVISVIIFDKSNGKYGFDLIVTLKICGNERYAWDLEVVEKELWLNLICEASIEIRFKDFKVINIRQYEADREKYSRPLNDRLAPFIRKNDLDKVAEEFLAKYYPKALESPTSVDVRQVAKNMGLKVCRHNIAEDGSIFGRIFFEDTIAKFYDNSKKRMCNIKVSANTIVYDPDAYFMDNIEKENSNTIIHKCIHYEYHRHTMAFQRIFNKKAKWIDCMTDGNTNDTIIDINKLEWQANVLAPRILMPYKTFSQEAYNLIEKYSCGNTYDTIDILPDVINALSSIYKVSKFSVKIRLCDIGINEAVGCNVWCDNYPVPPFAFDKGSCEYNETFVIPAIDAILLSLNPVIEDMMNKQQLVYIDSHLCLNTYEYIGVNKNGKKYIKHDALKHLNEFCIKMRMESKKYNNIYKLECFLNRDKNSKVHTNLRFDGMMDKMTEKAKTMEIIKEEKKFSSAFFDLNNDFSACMKLLKERSGLTYEEIELETGIEISSVKNIISGKRDGTLLRLTLILMALGAEPDVAFHIIDKAGVRIDKSNEEHLVCRFIINTMHADSMQNIINLIKSANLKI